MIDSTQIVINVIYITSIQGSLLLYFLATRLRTRYLMIQKATSTILRILIPVNRPKVPPKKDYGRKVMKIYSLLHSLKLNLNNFFNIYHLVGSKYGCP